MSVLICWLAVLLFDLPVSEDPSNPHLTISGIECGSFLYWVITFCSGTHTHTRNSCHRPPPRPYLPAQLAREAPITYTCIPTYDGPAQLCCCFVRACLCMCARACVRVVLV